MACLEMNGKMTVLILCLKMKIDGSLLLFISDYVQHHYETKHINNHKLITNCYTLEGNCCYYSVILVAYMDLCREGILCKTWTRGKSVMICSLRKMNSISFPKKWYLTIYCDVQVDRKCL